MCKLSEYVFEGKEGECWSEKCHHNFIKDYLIVPIKNISEFLNALSLRPLAIGIAANSLEFRYY